MRFIFGCMCWVIICREETTLLERTLEIMNSWEQTNKEYTEILYIILYSQSAEIISKENTLRFDDITGTDMYPIIYSAMYNACMEHNNVCVHSVVVEKGDNSILILGEFGSGKTTLALEFESRGWRIASYDQSILAVKDKKIILSLGSSCQCINGVRKFEENKRCPTAITTVVLIKGICNCGITLTQEVHGFNAIYRYTWRSFTWPWNTPLSNKREVIGVNQHKISTLFDFYQTFKRLRFFTVRGDVRGVVQHIEEQCDNEHFPAPCYE